MADIPRQQHYLAKFYLAGFTESGDSDGRLHVLDQVQIKEWVTTPANAAKSRDFYAVELDDAEDRAAVERLFSRLESDFSRVLRTIVRERRLPTGDDFDWFLNFVALSAARVPRIREIVSRNTDMFSKARLRQLFSTPEGWQEFRQIVATSGVRLCNDKYDEFSRFVLGDDYKVDLNQTSHVQTMIEMVDILLPALAARNWSLAIAMDSGPDFICSDVPISVFPTTKADVLKPLTIWSQNTVLCFPINRNMIAVASFEGRSPILGVSERGIAGFNSMTAREARQIFFPGPEFVYLARNEAILRTNDLLEVLRKRRGGPTTLEL